MYKRDAVSVSVHFPPQMRYNLTIIQLVVVAFFFFFFFLMLDGPRTAFHGLSTHESQRSPKRDPRGLPTVDYGSSVKKLTLDKKTPPFDNCSTVQDIDTNGLV